MHANPLAQFVASSALIFCLAFPAGAAAELAAGLGVTYDDSVSPALQQDLDDEIQDIFDGSSSYDWLPDEEGFDHLREELQGCFEEVCLLEIAGQLDATVGLVIDFKAEDELYEWDVQFYDLLEGELVAEDGGSCPLCGRAEVLEQFRASIHGRLVTLDVADRPDAPEIDPEEVVEVHLEGLPDDTEVIVDGETVTTGDVVLELTEGDHTLELIGDDHDDVIEQLTIDDDTPSPMYVRMHIAGDRPELNTVLARGDVIADSLGAARAPVGWTALGAGTALTVGSFFLANVHGEPACADDVAVQRCPDIYNTATLATTTTIVGVLSMIGGATLVAWPWLTDQPDAPADDADELDDPDASEEANLRLTPSFGADFGGFSVSGRF